MMLNREGEYSITRKYEAEQILDIICKSLDMPSEECVITDATAGFGGDTLGFSSRFKRVNAVEKNMDNYCLLIRNCMDCRNVDFYNDDCMKVINDIEQDVIYMDPPWGGVNYKMYSKISLYINGIPIRDIIPMLPKVPLFMKIPLNVDFSGILVRWKRIIYNKWGKPCFLLVEINNFPKK